MKKARKKKSSSPQNFPDAKWQKLDPTWRDAAESKKGEELEAEIIKSVKSLGQINKTMDEDKQLKVLKDDLKEISGAYRDALNAEKYKIDYAVYLINSRSGDDGSGESDDSESDE